MQTPAAMDAERRLSDARSKGNARWLQAADSAGIGVLNVALAVEVCLVFANTVARAVHREIVPGLEETAHLFLIYVAFIGGGVAYGRGRFMAVTAVVEKLPRTARLAVASVIDWTVIAIAAAIGGTTIPLQLMNAAERTPMLGVSFFWLTLPMMLGSLLFILHAGQSLWRRPRALALGSGALVLACVAVLLLSVGSDWTAGPALYIVLAAGFVVLILFGLPVGFVLAAVGIVYIVETGSAPPIAIAMTAQRGTGGFIFLALPFFILAGFIMDKGGIGERIVALLAAVLGHLRGGLLQVSIVAMYVASGISGSKAADMAAVGIPMTESFRRQGYDSAEAASVLAASAAMGESIPPSIAILALGSVTSLSTGALFLAGLLPAATIAALLMAVVYLRARYARWQPSPRATFRTQFAAGRRAILPMLMPVVLIGGIIDGIGTPTEISSFAVIYGLLLACCLYRLVGPRSLWELLTEANLLSGMIFFTFAGATLFSWALALEGVPDAVAGALGVLGPHMFLLAVCAITIVLGAVLESIVTVIILGPLLLPVAMHLGVDPLQFGIVLIEAFGIGSIVPPVGLGLYIACAIFRTEMHHTFRPVLGYLFVLCLGLVVVSAIPWITIVLPSAFGFSG
ncbi:MAG TPA: TRAP transporter large permease subunit [Acetobacteraceae bacterium]|jgi:tripartite ATP-independent transporter DctM subunit